MAPKLFSSRSRPVHLGQYPLERLRRGAMPGHVPPHPPLPKANGQPLIAAMAEHQAMMDAIRDGLVNRAQADIPDDLQERANHLKAFAYFADADLVGIGACPTPLRKPRINPGVADLAEALRTRQTKTLASGIDLIMADLRDAMAAPPGTITGHSHVLTVLVRTPRAPRSGEPGARWLAGAERHVAALRATEIAVVLANYIRLLGWDAKAHSETSTDLCLATCAVTSGVAWVEKAGATAPWLGQGFAVAAVSTAMALAEDGPLAAPQQQPKGWRRGAPRDPFASRDFALGPHRFE
ncbi:MAG: NAD-binding oxidoreductase, partial [Shimia sp.]